MIMADSCPGLETAHGKLLYPVYLPDATYGMVRAADAADLESAGVEGLVMNTFHLMQKPGSLVVQSLGGMHRMSGWNRPIITDSGGFQAYSLIRENESFGKMNEDGFIFYPEGSKRKVQFTPEKTIQLQLSFGTDVVICLDQCTHASDCSDEQEKSVIRTINWAKRCRAEFDKITRQKKFEGTGPKLFAVIQGGGSFELRKRCAEELLEIGFDGFGFGGWPLDSDGNLLYDILEYTRSLIPREFPIHALGIGHPENVARCFDLGYEIFDCAMPTRDARHGRLYSFDPDTTDFSDKWLKYLYINDEKHIRSDRPVMAACDCPVCRRYSAGYLRHLFKMGDSLFPRLATIHNVRVLTRLCEILRARKYGDQCRAGIA